MTLTNLHTMGLQGPAFDKEISEKDLWMPKSKKSLMNDLCKAISNRESVLLVGDPGVGKTCILRALRQRMDGKPYRFTYCHNATLGRRDFYRLLSLNLGLHTTSSAANLFSSVTQHVQDLANQNIHPVFVLDEAHLLHQDMLDNLHILMNYDWDSKPLLSLVMLGLPELEAKLSMKRNRSLFSRLRHRLQIDPLTPEDTADYLRLRLGVAGCDREVFTSESVSLIHEASDGCLRDTDRIAAYGLEQAAETKSKLVEVMHLWPSEEGSEL